MAHKIMQKYGFKEGQGLGKHEQGLSTALSVEKTSKRGGKIIIGDAAEKRKSDLCAFFFFVLSIFSLGLGNAFVFVFKRYISRLDQRSWLIEL